MGAIIDVVRWESNSNEQMYAWKFPHNNLSTYTQLIVAESQEAVLFSKGQIIGKFGAGKHTLNTENLPILRNLFGIPFGGVNPFTAEVWFVNKLMPLNLDWATDTMMYHDPDYQTMVPLIARGRYGVKIVDAEKFLVKLVGTSMTFSADQLADNFLGATISKTKSVLLQFILQNNIGLKKISAFLDPLSENLRMSIASFWGEYGFDLISFYITSIDVDAENVAGARIIDAMSRQSAQVIGGYTWQQSQAFELGDRAIDAMGQSHGSSGLLGAVLATNILGGNSGGAMFQTPVSIQQHQGQNGMLENNSNGAPKVVYCSNCAKKFTSNMKFCPHCGDSYNACIKCGADNDEKAKKCISCGTSLSNSQSNCSNCNSSVVDGTSFCGTCGKPVEAKVGGCQRCGYHKGNTPFCPQCGFKNV
jgi:membrane protease subunit (stomatin/prohibitin family)